MLNESCLYPLDRMNKTEVTEAIKNIFPLKLKLYFLKTIKPQQTAGDDFDKPVSERAPSCFKGAAFTWSQKNILHFLIHFFFLLHN